ncbi:hypothetical protein BURMUCF2_A0619 [Burkholderia multivorans CF2]|nr:hypothetical protein BURMUCF2_A0619 [Burkholderia multivorans CF2]
MCGRAERHRPALRVCESIHPCRRIPAADARSRRTAAGRRAMFGRRASCKHRPAAAATRRGPPHPSPHTPGTRWHNRCPFQVPFSGHASHCGADSNATEGPHHPL